MAEQYKRKPYLRNQTVCCPNIQPFQSMILISDVRRKTTAITELVSVLSLITSGTCASNDEDRLFNSFKTINDAKDAMFAVQFVHDSLAMRASCLVSGRFVQ